MQQTVRDLRANDLESDPMPDEIVIRFEHTVNSAVQASLDALTRAIAWTDDGSDAEAALLRAKAELLVARKHLSA